MYWSSAPLASQASHVTHWHTQSLFPHYLLFALCFSKSFPSAASVCMWQRIWELTQFMKPLFFGWRETQEDNSKPSNLGGVKSDLNYSGRTRARIGKSGGGFRLNQRQNLPLFTLPWLWGFPIQMFFSCKRRKKKKKKNPTAPLWACIFILQNWWTFFGLFSMDQGPGLWSSFIRGVKTCLKDSIVSPACTAWCRINVTNTLLYRLVSYAKKLEWQRDLKQNVSSRGHADQHKMILCRQRLNVIFFIYSKFFNETSHLHAFWAIFIISAGSGTSCRFESE